MIPEIVIGAVTVVQVGGYMRPLDANTAVPMGKSVVSFIATSEPKAEPVSGKLFMYVVPAVLDVFVPGTMRIRTW